jgi:phage shock protein A
MSKHGITGRVTQLARANVDAIVDAAEDPHRLLDQLVRAYTVNVVEAEQAIVRLLDNLRVAADDQQEDARAVVEWGRKAEAASQQADEFRAVGEAVEADRFDNLARVALERQLVAESDVEVAQHTIAAQHESIDSLRRGVDQIRSKLTALKRRQESHAMPSRSTRPDRSTSRKARDRLVEEAITTIEIMDPSSEVARFDEKVRREEARTHGRTELPASPLDALFADLDDADHEAQIEERLKALKAGRAMASAQAKVRAQAQSQPFR